MFLLATQPVRCLIPLERCEVLPQRIASWVDDGIEPVCTTCDVCIYCARDHALEGESPIPSAPLPYGGVLASSC